MSESVVKAEDLWKEYYNELMSSPSRAGVTNVYNKWAAVYEMVKNLIIITFPFSSFVPLTISGSYNWLLTVQKCFLLAGDSFDSSVVKTFGPFVGPTVEPNRTTE